MRRIQYFPLSTGTVDGELKLADWVFEGNDAIERRLLEKREAARANGFDIDAMLIWMGIGATINYEPDDVERKHGRYGFDGVTDGRAGIDMDLTYHILAMPELIRLIREHGLDVIAYLGCPRYTNRMVELRNATRGHPMTPQERRDAGNAYRQFCIDNLRPFKGAEIALDAMVPAVQSWSQELDLLRWWTGSPPIVEGGAPLLTPIGGANVSIISMMRHQHSLASLAGWRGPERIALFGAAKDWAAWGDRRATVADCEAAGISVCCDWSAV